MEKLTEKEIRESIELFKKDSIERQRLKKHHKAIC